MYVNRKVVPSYLNSRLMGVTREASTQHGTVQLLIGEVKDIIEPTSPKSLTKLYKEYTVDVQYSSGGGPITTVTFPNCLLMSSFGNGADHYQYTLRADPKKPQGKDVSLTGSKVLVLCVAGSSQQAFIVGAVRDDKTKDETGHNLNFEFNGVSAKIDKEGQFKFQFRGPTKVDGTLDTDAGASESKGPTTVEIRKDGTFYLYTKDEKQYLKIDHANKKVDCLFDQEWKVKVNQNVIEDYGGKWECTVGSSIKVQAAGNVDFNTSGGSWNMGATGNVNIKSAGVKIGAATDNMMKGRTFRMQQAILHTQLSAGLTSLGVQIAAGAVGITAAAADPVLAGMMPVAALGLTTAGTAFTSAVTMITQMVSALATFEAQQATYLSLVNFND